MIITVAEIPGTIGISLDWVQAIQGTYPIKGYEIYISINPVDPNNLSYYSLLVTLTTPVTHYEPPLPLPATTTYYYIRAFDTQTLPCYTTDSNIVSYTISASLLPPAAPQLNLSTDFVSFATLRWVASTQGSFPVAGYEVYRSTDGINYTLVSTTTNLIYSPSIGNPGTTYYYYVRAFDNQTVPSRLYSSNSNIVTYQVAVITFALDNNDNAYIDLTKLGNVIVDINIRLTAVASGNSGENNQGTGQNSSSSLTLFKDGSSTLKVAADYTIGAYGNTPSDSITSILASISHNNSISIISSLSGWYCYDSQGQDVCLNADCSAEIINCYIQNSTTSVSVIKKNYSIYNVNGGDEATVF